MKKPVLQSWLRISTFVILGVLILNSKVGKKELISGEKTNETIELGIYEVAVIEL